MPRPKPRLRGIPHLLGVIAAIPTVFFLIQAAQPGDHREAATVYGISLLCLLGSSALYHTPYWPKKIRGWIRSVDHAMIYVLIGGSYVPFLVALGDEAPSFVAPTVIVGCGLGMLQTIFWANAPRALRTTAYMVVGCLALLLVPAIYSKLGVDIFLLMISGGVCYLVGAVVYARRYPDPNPLFFGYHEVFHCLVNLAVALHVVAIWKILV